MSESDSDYSDNLDLLNELIDDANSQVKVKSEPVAHIKQENEFKRSDISGGIQSSHKAKSHNIEKNKCKWDENEKKLQEIVFGNKDKLLKNLQTTAERKSKKRKKHAQKPRRSAWKDSDDEGDDIVVNPESKQPELKRKQDHKQQLKSKFERILGTPAWAELDRKIEQDSDDDDTLQTIGHLAQPANQALVRGVLSFKKMKDLNRATYAEGPSITGIEFNPYSTVSLVAGSQGIATLYSIDGKKNERLHSLEFKNYPIRMCRFNKDGTEAIFGGSQKYFYTYDLIGGHTQRVFLPKTITKLSQFEVSPCGKYIGVIGRFGEVHLLYSSTKELITTFKQEHVATALAFSTDSMHLLTHSVDSEVNIFDLRQQRYVHRFTDDGCINGSHLSISPNGHLLATGSGQGVVNVYNYNDVFKSAIPMPVKTLLNLTTAISTTKFNHTSEVLAFASKDVNDAVKLVHFPSGTVYSNFPGIQGNLGKPTVVQFSPQSGYLAIGNQSKEVSLYRIKHYNDY